MNTSDDNSIFARCPQCGTRFRLKEEQLHSAGGLLRCGVCMHIFNGQPNIETAPTPEDIPPATGHETPAPTEHEPTFTSPDEEARTETTSDDTEVTPANDRAVNEIGTGTGTGTDTANQTATETPEIEPANQADPLAVLSAINTQEHDFEHHRPRPGYSPPPWLLLNALAALLLLGQLLYWQHDRLLASQLGRQALDYCQQQQWNCQQWLPTEPSPAAASSTQSAQTADLRAEKLLIRQHPDHPQALLVDTLLINRGAVPQPFPQLYLRFSNLNDRELASRIFGAGDYLTGELRKQRWLAPQQPVHISLAIVDPGPEAVNYRLQLFPGSP